MRLIDADALKAHYSWWAGVASRAQDKDVLDQIVDAQPTVGGMIDVDALKEWAEVVPLTPDGGIDINDFEKKLRSMSGGEE